MDHLLRSFQGWEEDPSLLTAVYARGFPKERGWQDGGEDFSIEIRITFKGGTCLYLLVLCYIC